MNDVAVDVMSKVPGARLSSDSKYREVDLAIDWNEEASLSREDAETCVQMHPQGGVHRGALERARQLRAAALRQAVGVHDGRAPGARRRRATTSSPYVYVGDALNDAPMFGGFPTSVGVANVKQWWDELDVQAGVPDRAARGRRACASSSSTCCCRCRERKLTPSKPFAAALRALDAGHGVAIATVIGAHGSTPRHLGARMAVVDDGEQWGTIGGGRIEAARRRGGARGRGGRRPRVVRQHLVRDLAMCCGGSMEVAITPGAPSRDVDRAARDARAAAHVLTTPLDGGPLALRAGRDRRPRAHAPGRGRRARRASSARVERAIVFGLGHVGARARAAARRRSASR